MLLLNIIQCTNLGGMEQSNLLRLRGLIARGHDVEVISLTPLGALAPLLRQAGIPAMGLEYRGILGWRSMLAMRRIFRQQRPDAILMTGHNLAATLCLIGIRARRKVQAIHYHHFEGGGGLLKWRIIYWVANAVFDRFTFCSRYIFEEAASASPRLRPKSRVVADPFEVAPAATAAEKAAAKSALGLAAAAPVIGNAGWLIPRKRFDVFLQTAAVVLQRCPDAVFLIAGDGPERAALESLAAELGISRSIRLLGWKSRLVDFYRALDVLLFNSDCDALGRVPLEAAAAGVPVVASLLKGGLSEALRPPDEIVLIDQHNVEVLANAVVDLLGDVDCRASASAAAHRRVIEYGNALSHARAIEGLLEGRD